VGEVAPDALADEAKGMGAARVVRVAVKVASHTCRLAAASAEFPNALNQVPIKPDAGARLFSGIDGSPVIDIAAGVDKLAEQISHTVQWADCLEDCVEGGMSAFLEFGPGRALTEMAAGAYPDVPLAASKTSGHCRARALGRRVSPADPPGDSCSPLMTWTILSAR
jgi:[acyl-carrier-protein] S-malonyltransferase